MLRSPPLHRERRSNITDNELFEASFLKPDPLVGHSPKPEYYRKPKYEPITGEYEFTSSRVGVLQRNPPYDNINVYETNKFKISWMLYGDEGPLCTIIHGVPSNKLENVEMSLLMQGHCRILSIDMLGMGESSMPKMKNADNDWKWKQDIEYLIKIVFGDNIDGPLFNQESGPFKKVDKTIWVGKDWGGAHAILCSSVYPDLTAGLVLIDPIFGPSYPVSEIQAIGRMSMLNFMINKAVEDGSLPPENAYILKQMAIGSFDQTLVQILKTMVHKPKIWNRWSLADIKKTYIDADYERLNINEEDGSIDYANSLTMRLKEWNIDVLAERSAILAPNLLMPYHDKLNPEGVKYTDITADVLVVWGRNDNMMSPEAAWRLYDFLPNARVQIRFVKGAGHFADRDHPKEVVEMMFSWMKEYGGPTILADVFIGLKGVWKGDEKEYIENMRKIHYGTKTPL